MPRPLAPGRFVLRTLQEANAPLMALDGTRQIVFVNDALAHWLGIDAEKLIGQRCEYRAAAEGELAAACAALCPPPEAFAGTATEGFVSRLANAERPFERRTARFVRLDSREPDQALLLVLIADQLADERQPTAAIHASEKLHTALVALRSQLGQRFHISQLVGESDVLRRVREQVRIAADARSRVVVIGPPGSGREHVARTIHFAQKSSSIGPLVPIACELVDAEQMQASLTALLREQYESPAERPPAALLLDVDRLREAAQQELAGFFALPGVELHTLATSRVRLDRLVRKGKFRSELACALSTLEIVLPPLASRAADVPLLAQHFLEAAASALAKPLSGFQPAAIELLLSLPWRGNLDELERAVRDACVRAAGPRVLVADLPDWVHLAQDAVLRAPREEPPIQLDAWLERIEKELLARAMRKAGGNKSKAAELLGISRQRLLRRLEQLGLISRTEIEEPVIFEPLPDET